MSQRITTRRSILYTFTLRFDDGRKDAVMCIRSGQLFFAIQWWKYSQHGMSRHTAFMHYVYMYTQCISCASQMEYRLLYMSSNPFERAGWCCDLHARKANILYWVSCSTRALNVSLLCVAHQSRPECRSQKVFICIYGSMTHPPYDILYTTHAFVWLWSPSLIQFDCIQHFKPS